jgi:hypothetical protein
MIIALFVLFAPIYFDLDIGLSLSRLRQNAESRNSVSGAAKPMVKPTQSDAGHAAVAAGRTEVPDDMLTITITGGTPGSPAENQDALAEQK